MTLTEFFAQNTMLAVAFSGGVDSSYLLCCAKRAGVRVKGYYVKSEFQPDFEMDDALKLAREFSVDIEIIKTEILADEVVSKNPEDRCYYCKRRIFSKIIERAYADGFLLVCDGTNASDDIPDRPGIRAIGELDVASPLRLCGVTKEQIRTYSKELGLFTADKPSYACLATRIPAGHRITNEILRKIEKSEARLFELGFTDFRVRVARDCARLQITAAELPLFSDRQKEVSQILLESFSDAVLDLKNQRIAE